MAAGDGFRVVLEHAGNIGVSINHDTLGHRCRRSAGSKNIVLFLLLHLFLLFSFMIRLEPESRTLILAR